MSARPRPSSSATIATSTPEASGAPSARASRSSRQPGGGDGGVELVGPLDVVELPYGVRTQPVDDLGGGVAECLLLGGEPDVHQRILPFRQKRRLQLFPERPAQHLARGQPGDGVDHDNSRSCL